MGVCRQAEGLHKIPANLKLNSFMAFEFRGQAQGLYNEPCANFAHFVFVVSKPTIPAGVPPL